jgi:hypothetical protein
MQQNLNPLEFIVWLFLLVTVLGQKVTVELDTYKFKFKVQVAVEAATVSQVPQADTRKEC